MVKRKLKLGRVFVALFLLILLIACTGVGVFFYELSPVDKSKENITYEVKSGTTVNEIFEDLESKKIIRSALFMKIYSKLNHGLSVDAGEYTISSGMSSREIFDVLGGDATSSRETVTLVFREGRNVRDLIKLLETQFGIKKEDVLSKLKDEEYLDSLISKYWFLTDEIKDKDIYYSLEGYLFPDTYLVYKDASVEEILTKMLDETGKKLEKFKSDIENSSYSVHEILTLASIVELESSNKSDRKEIAGVFTNRLKDKWSLGSCVSTYYAFDINMGDRDLNMSEIADCSNKYNTRCTTFIGLPVGPIGNPGLDSIEATISPSETDYYYFLSDKDGNTYFSKTQAEHDRKGRELRANGQMLYN